MTIILSSQVNVTSDSVVSNALSSFGEALGIPGFSQPGSPGRATSDIIAIKEKMNSVLNKLLGRSQDQFDPNYVDSGRQVIVGGNIQGGKVPALEAANVRQVYTQAPQANVIVKKRAFSSLQDLYNPIYMDPSEKWLLRATKRLVARKCDIMAEYERLSKIEKMADLGISTGTIIGSLVSSTAEEMGNSNEYTSIEELKKVIYDRQPVKTTTYFVDPDLPTLEQFGFGHGVFEITAVTNISTALSLDGNGSFSLSIEDPYRILFITEEDIEAALRETAMSNIVNQLDSAAGNALNTAQIADDKLVDARKQSGKSAISFNVGLSTGSGVSAVIDAIGLEVNIGNLDDIPDNQSLDSREQVLFIAVTSSLQIYQQAVSKSLITGTNDDNVREDIRLQMQSARNKLRTFYLGKSVIQPMDTINLFIDSGTRRLGEAENVDENTNIFTAEGAMNFGANLLGLREGGVDVDEKLLYTEWCRAGKFPDWKTFKKIRTLTLSTESGTHVFGGLVTRVEDRFEASSGTYVLNVSGNSNMHWLDVSRYNEQPSLDQTQGVVYDPLTPFDIKTDKATGLPTGKPTLSYANVKILGELQKKKLYFDSGPNTGKEMKLEKDLEQDVKTIGNNIVKIYHHAPGLVYKWKEGIMTATYDMHNANPKDGSRITSQQLRRDIGFFASNTAFDNMDAANVLSILITGKPYNPSTFIQSAMNTGAFVPDSTLNSGRDYFQSLLNVQGSLIKTHGNFVPFKLINVNAAELARSVALQHRLTNKSSELTQLRNKVAKLSDQESNLVSNDLDKTLVASIKAKKEEVSKKADSVEKKLSELTSGKNQLADNTIQIAGNDISFDLNGIRNEEEFRLFGDRLSFATLRLRENVIRNKDKNYFIVSDEYDKDYDIQSFVLKLRESAPDMWKSSWQPLRQLCQNVADTLNFEFFCMAKDTLILAKNDDDIISLKYVKDFNDRDSVLSIDTDGAVTWKKARLHRRLLSQNEYMLRMRTGAGYHITLSNNHRLLDENLKEIKMSDLSVGDRVGTLKKLPNIEKEVNIDVAELFKNHKWFINKDQFFKLGGQGSKCKEIPKSVVLDSDLSWFLGMYVAEGSISHPQNRHGRGYHTVFALHFDEDQTAQKLVAISKNKFNVVGNIYKYKKYTRCTVDFGSQVLTETIKSIFGLKTCHLKSIPDFIWHSSTENKLAFVAGLCEGDAGYDRRISLSSINNKLLNEVSILLLMVGVASRIDKHNKLHIYGKENIKRLLPYMKSWHHYDDADKYCKKEGNCSNRHKSPTNVIKNIEVVDYNDYVYDFEVEDNHTFVIHNTLSHNCDTQGHIVFRPPQYNRTPASVMDQMLSLKTFGGVQLYPDFLTNLFQTREQSLVRDITVAEWKIRKEAALLGKSDVGDVELLISSYSGAQEKFITNGANSYKDAVEGNRALTPKERKDLRDLVRSSNKNTQLASDGLFSPVAQRNLQKNYISEYTMMAEHAGLEETTSNQVAYEEAIDSLVNLTGMQKRNFPEFDKVRVGAKRNGQSTPATDIANIISRIAQLISDRSRFLKILDQTLNQNIEIADKLTDGSVSLSKANITSVSDMPKGLFNKMIQDDTRDTLGYLSKDRFIIKDEHIISSQFSEEPPAITNCTVTGTAPVVGGQGDLAGVPVFTAFSADFDLWRQYGWRGEKAFHKPFFQSAEFQCAPYAVMLLSRQRKNIVTGTITVIGNEYYQLGDVVYVTHRQMLYYVNKIQHNFNYEGTFNTTLELKYGHPIGQYIPTPLDVIGKMQTTSGAHQNSYRIRREPSRSDTLLGVVVFDKGSKDLLGGKHGQRNYQQLMNSSLVAQTELNKKSPDTSYRIYCMTFFGDDSEQNSRAELVKKWFLNPEKPGAARDGIGKDGLGGSVSPTATEPGSGHGLSKMTIDDKLVKVQRVRQELPKGNKLTVAEQQLLAEGVSASQEAIALDPTLSNAVEIRLRPPPTKGWAAEEKEKKQ